MRELWPFVVGFSLLSLLVLAVCLIVIKAQGTGLATETAERPPKRAARPARASSAPARPSGPACPLCDRALPGGMKGNRQHFLLHVDEIEHGAAMGKYTWTCARCGPADMYWDNPSAASFGLLVHMDQRHGVRMRPY